MRNPRSKLTPTARLTLLIVHQEGKPLSYPELEILTGSSRAALDKTVPGLVDKGLLVRVVHNNMSCFARPSQETISDVAGGAK